jgi:hypothetical protein
MGCLSDGSTFHSPQVGKLAPAPLMSGELESAQQKEANHGSEAIHSTRFH